jgi:hypothetical protein
MTLSRSGVLKFGSQPQWLYLWSRRRSRRRSQECHFCDVNVGSRWDIRLSITDNGIAKLKENPDELIIRDVHSRLQRTFQTCSHSSFPCCLPCARSVRSQQQYSSDSRPLGRPRPTTHAPDVPQHSFLGPALGPLPGLLLASESYRKLQESYRIGHSENISNDVRFRIAGM